MAKPTFSTAAQVRAFAAENGITVGARGVLSAEAVEAYNAANPRAKYVVGAVDLVERKVKTTNARGAKITKVVRFDPREARAYGVEQGLVTSTRGRTPEAALTAYAESLV